MTDFTNLNNQLETITCFVTKIYHTKMSIWDGMKIINYNEITLLVINGIDYFRTRRLRMKAKLTSVKNTS